MSVPSFGRCFQVRPFPTQCLHGVAVRQTPALSCTEGQEWGWCTGCQGVRGGSGKRIWREDPGPRRGSGWWRRGGECARGSSEGNAEPAQGRVPQYCHPTDTDSGCDCRRYMFYFKCLPNGLKMSKSNI